MNRFVGNCVLGCVLASFAIVGGATMCRVQELATGRIRVSGTLSSPPGAPVMLTARLPSDFGLSERERREEWPALNEEHIEEVSLSESTFRVEFPPLMYCVQRWTWAPRPPPPARLVLRFSDAPGEDYVVWNVGEQLGYVVRDAEGASKPKDEAAWRLRIGSYGPAPREGDVNVWSLSMELARQTGQRASGAAPATPPATGFWSRCSVRSKHETASLTQCP